MRRARLQLLARRTIAIHALGIAAGCGDRSLPTAPASAPTPSSVGPASSDSSVSASAERCLPEGGGLGAWLVRFDGYGCARMADGIDGPTFALAPDAADGAHATHAQLLLGPATGARLTLDVEVMTTRQLRTGAAPNPWEVAWVVWHHTDDEHFYYFIPKPNGWELGKRDPAYPGGQRFLATGSAPRHPVGRWTRVRITQQDGTTTVHVDGVRLVAYTDAERPYTTGRVGLYSEDAAVLARGVVVR
jgi:hypothetical protein